MIALIIILVAVASILVYAAVGMSAICNHIESELKDL